MEIGVRILPTKHAKEHEMKIYISGAISGLETAVAFQNFERAEDLLRERGHEPVNPMKKVSEQEGKSWEEYMKEDIPIMLECDGIFMLSNYHGSRGARLELYVAEALGMEVMHEVNA